jgi:hypothetical protein
MYINFHSIISICMTLQLMCTTYFAKTKSDKFLSSLAMLVIKITGWNCTDTLQKHSTINRVGIIYPFPSSPSSTTLPATLNGDALGLRGSLL